MGKETSNDTEVKHHLRGCSKTSISKHLVGELDPPSLVLVYTGPGKGKTTAALGQAFRAIGHGWNVHVIQFLKGSSYAGELWAAQRLFPSLEITQFGRGCEHSALIRQGNIKCTGCGRCFIKRTGVKPDDYERINLAWEHTLEVVHSGRFQMVVLDEIGNALRYNLIESSIIIQMIKNRPPHVNLVMTGRGITEDIIEVADLVTEMQMIKHPYEKGIASRKGIEF